MPGEWGRSEHPREISLSGFPERHPIQTSNLPKQMMSAGREYRLMESLSPSRRSQGQDHHTLEEDPTVQKTTEQNSQLTPKQDKAHSKQKRN